MITLDDSTLPCRGYAEVSGANNVIEIVVEPGVVEVSIRPVTNDGKLSFLATLSDGDSISDDPTEPAPLDADVWTTIRLERSRAEGVARLEKLFVTSATDGTAFHVIGSR